MERDVRFNLLLTVEAEGDVLSRAKNDMHSLSSVPTILKRATSDVSRLPAQDGVVVLTGRRRGRALLLARGDLRAALGEEDARAAVPDLGPVADGAEHDERDAVPRGVCARVRVDVVGRGQDRTDWRGAGASGCRAGRSGRRGRGARSRRRC
jgi:hypothetical protein